MTPLVLPPEDRGLSPWTGWTRAHWEAVADHLLDGVLPHRSAGGALYDLPGRRPSLAGRRSDAFEGFARTFLLAAARIPHAPDDVRERLVERYAEGLAEGTRPGSTEGWPVIRDLSQSMVEAASVAIGLAWTRPWLWDRLADDARDRLAEYLLALGRHPQHPNNWVLFRVVALGFLASVGVPVDRGLIAEALDRVEGWYRGDGWSTDGGGLGATHYDGYVGFGMHLYPLLWTTFDGASDPARAERFRSRVGPYNEAFVHLVGADGAPLAQGRSLTYRAAVAAPLWAAELAGATSVAPGLARRAATGLLRHAVENGGLQDGLLTLGVRGPDLSAVQSYSGPASPYWTSKAFAGLLLPPDHPAWTDREEALPHERADTTLALRAPGWLVHGTREDGVVRVLNHGTARGAHERGARSGYDALYERLAYSTATAPVTGTPPTGPAAPVPGDNDAVVVDASGVVLRRGRPTTLLLTGAAGDPGAAASRWPLAASPWTAPSAVLDVLSLVRDGLEVRVHVVRGAAGGRLHVSGYPATADAEPEQAAGPGWVAARAGDGTWSALAAPGDVALVRHGATAFGPHTLVPVAAASVGDDVAVLATVVAVHREPGHGGERLTATTVEVVDGVVHVRWPDGATQQVEL